MQTKSSVTGQEIEVVRADVLGPMVLSRCASLLKPLYAWVTPDSSWLDVEASVCWSDNEATDRIVGANGLPVTLDRVQSCTGVGWFPARTWGQVQVCAGQVETAYGALVAAAAAGDGRAAAVLELMRSVVPWQRFGVAPGVAMKAGWDLDCAGARTHVVVIGGGVVSVVLTSASVGPAWRSRWSAAAGREPSELARMHHGLLGVPFCSEPVAVGAT